MYAAHRQEADGARGLRQAPGRDAANHASEQAERDRAAAPAGARRRRSKRRGRATSLPPPLRDGRRVGRATSAAPDERRPRCRPRVRADRCVDLSTQPRELPPGSTRIPKVEARARRCAARRRRGQRPFDWGTAEMLAYASLVSEGVPVRLSGQDARRGTFSHRHAVLVDTETGALVHAARAPRASRARFEVWDSPLSEAGVLGFEYGYSLDYPDGLVHLGGAVRRLRERRAGHHRPVHRLGRRQVATA